MRLALYSDLHLEHASWNSPRLDVDTVILVGDISRHSHGIEWAANDFNKNAEIFKSPEIWPLNISAITLRVALVE